ncbi:MAG: hypothetical protein JXR96_26295 [Deltaproteobacteria bacterium]|nr:hypothetical protein [Deltaproteobacteria bacterium]
MLIPPSIYFQIAEWRADSAGEEAALARPSLRPAILLSVLSWFLLLFAVCLGPRSMWGWETFEDPIQYVPVFVGAFLTLLAGFTATRPRASLLPRIAILSLGSGWFVLLGTRWQVAG